MNRLNLFYVLIFLFIGVVISKENERNCSIEVCIERMMCSILTCNIDL